MCYANIFTRSSSFSNHTRPRNVKEANNSFVFNWEGGFLVYTDRGSWSLKLDEHICKRLSVLSVWEKVVFVTVALEFYCPSTLLRSFLVRSIIITTPFLGSHHALVHIMTVEIVSWPIFANKKSTCFTLMTNLHKSMSPNVRIESATVRMRAQWSARPTALGKRERERERESFLLCDSSRSLESLYFT